MSRQRRSRQRGVSIIMAVFLLLLFAAISAFMASLIGTAHTTSAQDVEGVRAYQAARAGAEWGIFQLDPNAGAASLPDCFGATTLAQIPNFSVAVSCTASDYTESGRGVRIYQITATANAVNFRQPGIERQVVVTVEKCRDPAITAAPYDC